MAEEELKQRQKEEQQKLMNEKMPKVLDSQKATALGIFMKKNNINIHAVVEFIKQGGSSSHEAGRTSNFDSKPVSVSVIEELAKFIIPSKKNAEKLEQEVSLFYFNEI